ncbi:hypothetical protein SAMN02745784_02936 [Tissierella praeacuta DSM 18095]|uniref:Uncharacterized protein n=1 Tax=Tissierella praeacuta DSM 18095 TaxID=1123404 RepID=A0A1M4Z779_9FIRM|nr:hypothetical protein [Tissierella praeacuta]SHF13808.1 hypothetical protein SAMN02745784_02936 [Tissierella praeacuta DSM 18095]SUP00569.1 Uncharacterised protein [Tissierella praeacuta]
MSSIGITVYGVRIQESQTNQNYLLNNLEGESFFNIFIKFMKEYSNEYSNNGKLEKIFKIEKYNSGVYNENHTELYDYIIGQVKTGAYGYSAEIVNTNTGIIKYNKETDDAEVMPFFFTLCIPRGKADVGLLILQTHGIYGIKTIFTEFLSEFLKGIQSDYNLITGNVAPIAYINRYLKEAELQKIRFIRYNIPHDPANQIAMNNGVNAEYDEYILHKPVGFLKRRGQEIQQCIRGQRAVNHVIEIQNFDYDNIKLDFKLGKKSKTINLSNIDNLVINEDITDLINLIDGHPTKESIEPILIETCTDYLKDMGLI